jgi:hypothetical protein
MNEKSTPVPLVMDFKNSVRPDNQQRTTRSMICSGRNNADAELFNSKLKH